MPISQCIIIEVVYSIFFWVKTPSAPGSWKHKFDWHRDCIYIATLLLGSGGTIVLVIALSMVAFLVQDYKVTSTLTLVTS